ncbi:MAG: phage major capsid protein [Flavobacterium sp.]|nr:phage major capsid protein [Flavobacterium sp.]
MENEKEFIEKVKSEVSAKITEMLDSNAAIKQVAELNEKMKTAATKAEIDAVKAAVDQLGLDIKANAESASKKAGASAKEQVVAFLGQKKSEIEGLSKNKSGSVAFDLNLKSAGTFTTSNVDAVGTNGISILLSDIEPGITPTPSARPTVMTYLNRGTMMGSYVVYAEMKNNDGGAGNTAEGSAKTAMDFDIVEAKSDAKKITSYIKTSKEALSDIQALSAEINGELLVLIMNKIEDDILEGGGTNALQGLSDTTNVSTAYSAGTFANTIANANIYDVVNTAASQIMTAEVISGRPAGFMPNIVIMNPEDVVKLKLTKDSTGQYLFPVSLPGTPSISGLTVVPSPWLTKDKFIVADSTKIMFRVREDVNISIGYENDDFTKNLVTILAEARVAMYVKSNHKKAVVYGDITDAIVALDPAT